MTTILTPKRNRNSEIVPARAYLRPDWVTPPGINRRIGSHMHPVKKRQQSRKFKAVVSYFQERQHSYQPDDRVYLTGRPTPRKRVPGLNCPSEGETWAHFAAFRAAYGLAPIEPW